jgi:hypothetical protein
MDDRKFVRRLKSTIKDAMHDPGTNISRLSQREYDALYISISNRVVELLQESGKINLVQRLEES